MRMASYIWANCHHLKFHDLILTSQQIILRDWQLSDFETYRNWHKGHQQWMDFNGPYYPRPGLEQLDESIAKYRKQIEESAWPTPRTRIVIADKETNLLIGTVSWYWQSIETNWLSIGIAIYDDRQWGKGIGKEALSLWVDYLFDSNKDLVRMDLRTWSGNLGMIRLAEKLGFREEARFRKARIVKGAYYDSIGMGILRSEWRQ